MTFLDFYKIDLTSVVIILLSGLAIFSLLNYNEKDKDNNFNFNFLVSAISGVLISIFYSYITLESDTILTSNYWD